MKSLKLIPAFFLLMVLTYFGVQFVEANRDEVVVNLGSWSSRSVTLGFVILTSFFLGTLFSALLSATELLRLYVEMHRLKRKNQELLSFASKKEEGNEKATVMTAPHDSHASVSKPTGRFS